MKPVKVLHLPYEDCNETYLSCPICESPPDYCLDHNHYKCNDCGDHLEIGSVLDVYGDNNDYWYCQRCSNVDYLIMECVSKIVDATSWLSKYLLASATTTHEGIQELKLLKLKSRLKFRDWFYTRIKNYQDFDSDQVMKVINSHKSDMDGYLSCCHDMFNNGLMSHIDSYLYNDHIDNYHNSLLELNLLIEYKKTYNHDIIDHLI